MDRKSALSVTLLIISLLMSIVDVMLNLQGREVSELTYVIWNFIFFIFTVLWVKYDAQENHFPCPFEFDFLVYLYWPVAFPWYLIKTRGIEGILLLSGFVALLFAPWVSGLIAYVYFA